MKPVKAQDLLRMDPRLEAVVLQCYPIPEQVVYQAAKNDYSEDPIHHQKIPQPRECGKWVVETLLANERGHYGCYSSDTEVLTDKGWVYWTNVNEETTLAAYDTKTGGVNFEKPSAVQHWDYNGKMYHLEGQSLDFLVSPDHRMIVQSRESDGTWSSTHAITAEEVFNKPVRYITSGFLSESERVQVATPMDNPLFWSLIGLWIHHGVMGMPQNGLYFPPLSSPLITDRLRYICNNLGLSFGLIHGGEFWYGVSHPEICSWLRENYTSASLNDQKKLPDHYLKLDRECAINLLAGLKISYGGIIKTYSSTLVDQIQALEALNGMQFNCRIEEDHDHNKIYALDVKANLYPRVGDGETTQKWVDYSGQIHCATVSTGALIVRRNYKVAICGNCLEHPQITFSTAGYVHSVMVQARTHRISTSFDCLAGESLITVKHNNKIENRAISQLYELFENGQKLPLVRNLNEPIGSFDYAEIRKVFKNTEKDLYIATLDDGKQLKCSMDHRIFTEDGWKRLKHLNIGSKVACNGVKTYFVPIKSIEFLRRDITYDIEVNGKYHNFVCDGVVVHNCQSQRYTGKRVLKVASGELPVDDVFYIRPPGYYTNRQGRKYEWTQEHYDKKLKFIHECCKDYAVDYAYGASEEHIRDYLPQGIRQNFVVSFNLRSLLHFMDLRAKLDAQIEIQALCEQLAPELQKWAPNVWNYYAEKRLHKAKLSP